MRRVALAVVLTVAGLIALLSFRTHPSGPSGSPGSPGSPGDQGAGGQSVLSAPPLRPGERGITGSTVSTVYGPVQVEAVLRASKIVGVNILRRPAETNMDVQIGQYAFPKLIGETLIAQSARIDTVSGATYTSGGYIRSLQSALDSGASGTSTPAKSALGNRVP